ncbi:tyrosine-protein kinase STYK1-like [Trachemys scripta elegans]|uniref:tyrosine-protein kinase STYK1-like n=1 Tax=Trachemys scripta elegans TaxID=31138 RepID=UPI001551B454|nr:tyrosine-protein kinase STYK1-like [Trachemys scripta elegans]
MGSQHRHCNFSSGEYLCNENGMRHAMIIIPSFLASSTLLVVAVIVWKTCRRGRDAEREPIILVEDDVPGQDGKEYDSLPTATSAERILEFKDSLLAKWELPKDWNIQEEAFLGMGRYGQISRATLIQTGSLGPSLSVILRKLPVATSPQEMKDFIEMMKFHIKICKHDSLVKVLWCQSQALPLCLILEAMSLGNLLQFLWQARQEDLPIKGHLYELTEKSVFTMAIQIARGLEYLTESQKLIHGDVAARNVLIHQDMTVRLCGLGLAGEVYRRGMLPSRKAAEVPIKWLPPERILKHPVTAKGDVWSFGILLYEMITLGAPPYPTLLPSEVLSWLQRQHRMQKPQQCGSNLYRIMRSCWQWKASKRPTFSQLINQLDSHMPHANGAEPLTATERLVFSDYQRIAGVSPGEVPLELCLSDPCLKHNTDNNSTPL